jgi:hypothetical protein
LKILNQNQSCNFLPAYQLFIPTIDVQISSFSGVRLSKLNLLSNHLHPVTSNQPNQPKAHFPTRNEISSNSLLSIEALTAVTTK